MPIEFDVPVRKITYDEFHAVDYEVMGYVFSIHRELGRFWSEKIYRDELAYRCKRAGFENVYTEIPVHISYEDFIKVYFIDLIVNNVIYELKTAQALTKEHEKQAINYLMLTGQNHGKLINMRPSSVKHYYVSTNITPEKRYDYKINYQQWHGDCYIVS